MFYLSTSLTNDSTELIRHKHSANDFVGVCLESIKRLISVTVAVGKAIPVVTAADRQHPLACGGGQSTVTEINHF